MKQLVDLNRIQLFIDIVKAGNLTKASRMLGLQKSKLSRDLSLLEQELGTQLVYRTTRRFQLTDAGRNLFDGARDSLGSLHTLIDRSMKSAAEVEGPISLTCPEDIGEIIVTPILQEFLKEYPKVVLNLHFTSHVVDLVAQGIDLGVRAGSLQDSSLRVRKVGSIQMGLFCSKAFYESHSDRLNFESLSKMPVVAFANNGDRPTWNLKSGHERKRILLSPTVTVNSYLIVHKFILQNHGIGLLPRFIAEKGTDSGQLVHLFKDWTTQSAPIQLVFPQQKEPPARIKVLTDYLVKKMRIYF